MAGGHYILFAFICALLSLFTLGMANTTYLDVIIVTTETIPNFFGTGSLIMTATWTSSAMTLNQTAFAPTTVTLVPATITVTISELSATMSTKSTNLAGLCYLPGDLLEKCSGTAKPTTQSNIALPARFNPLSQLVRDLKWIRSLTINYWKPDPSSALRPRCDVGNPMPDFECPTPSDQTSAAIRHQVNPLSRLTENIKKFQSVVGKVVSYGRVCIESMKSSPSRAVSTVSSSLSPIENAPTQDKLASLMNSPPRSNLTPRFNYTFPVVSLAPHANQTSQPNSTTPYNLSQQQAHYSAFCSDCSAPPFLYTPIIIGVCALFHALWMYQKWSSTDGEMDGYMVRDFLAFWTMSTFTVVYLEYDKFGPASMWKSCLDNGCAVFLGKSVFNITAV